jgi:hypothetical protein
MVIETEVKGKVNSIKPRYPLPGEEFTVRSGGQVYNIRACPAKGSAF